MTLHAPTPRPAATPLHVPTATGPTYVFEAILPAPHADTITVDVPGWAVRVWPVARLGDATLEARALTPHAQPADLADALRRAHVTPLGPLRPRHP